MKKDKWFRKWYKFLWTFMNITSLKKVVKKKRERETFFQFFMMLQKNVLPPSHSRQCTVTVRLPQQAR